MKKSISVILLLSLLSPYCLFSQEASAALSSVERIRQIVQELNEIQNEKEIYLQELENINSENRKEITEREKELQERLNELAQREKELSDLKRQLELFGSLIDEQANYYKKLQKKLTFWQITSGVLAAALAGTLVTITVTSK